MIWVNKMGGYGSSRQSGRRTTSSVTSVNVKDLGASDRLHGSVRFRYTLNGKPVEHTVYLMQTDCHYGGVRYWFILRAGTIAENKIARIRIYQWMAIYKIRKTDRVEYRVQNA
jgi:hypothetical protein